MWISAIAVVLVCSSTTLPYVLAGPVSNLCRDLEKPVDLSGCTETEYAKYVSCVEGIKQKRSKRQLLCPNSQHLQSIVQPMSCIDLATQCQVRCGGITNAACVSQCPKCFQSSSNIPLGDISQSVSNNYFQQSGLGTPGFVVDYGNSGGAGIIGHTGGTESVGGTSTVKNITITQIVPPNTVVDIQMPQQSGGGGVFEQVVVSPPILNQSNDGNSNSNPSVVITAPHGNIPTTIERSLPGGHNITTVIKLTNIVNNTNVVNVPTNVNSTNVNNINVYTNVTSSPEGGKFGLGYDERGSCCFAVQPKRCMPSANGPRCHHRRHRTCGDHCTSRIMHAQSRRRCSSRGQCENRVAYVPQPHRQRCVHTPSWPFVSCGGSQQRSCEGCYDHYGYGMEAYYGGEGAPQKCHGCYDDGFDMGQRYRRGPFMRPYYYHQPPCWLTGNCYGMQPPPCGPYGCFAHDRIDPAWGGSYYPEEEYYERPPPFLADDQLADYDIMEEDPSLANDTESITDGTHDWSMPIHKCRVVNGDGTITIQNCTVANTGVNPYGGVPVGQHLRTATDNENFVDGPFREQEAAEYYPESVSYGFYGADEMPRRHRRHLRKEKHHRTPKHTYVEANDDEEQFFYKQ